MKYAGILFTENQREPVKKCYAHKGVNHMGLLEQLESIGVDVQDGLKRFKNNEQLYTMMLVELTKSLKETQALPDYYKGDYEAALLQAHTLKGMTGNLSVTPLYEGYARAVDLFREGKPKEAGKVLEQLVVTRDLVIAYIENYTSV